MNPSLSFSIGTTPEVVSKALLSHHQLRIFTNNLNKVDIGVYGVAGVDEDGTLLDFYEEEVQARQLIRENSRRAFLVLDHTKFGRAAHVRGGRIDEASKFFAIGCPLRTFFPFLNDPIPN